MEMIILGVLVLLLSAIIVVVIKQNSINKNIEDIRASLTKSNSIDRRKTDHLKEWLKSYKQLLEEEKELVEIEK